MENKLSLSRKLLIGGLFWSSALITTLLGGWLINRHYHNKAKEITTQYQTQVTSLNKKINSLEDRLTAQDSKLKTHSSPLTAHSSKDYSSKILQTQKTLASASKFTARVYDACNKSIFELEKTHKFKISELLSYGAILDFKVFYKPHIMNTDYSSWSKTSENFHSWIKEQSGVYLSELRKLGTLRRNSKQVEQIRELGYLEFEVKERLGELRSLQRGYNQHAWSLKNRHYDDKLSIYHSAISNRAGLNKPKNRPTFATNY